MRVFSTSPYCRESSLFSLPPPHSSSCEPWKTLQKFVFPAPSWSLALSAAAGFSFSAQMWKIAEDAGSEAQQKANSWPCWQRSHCWAGAVPPSARSLNSDSCHGAQCPSPAQGSWVNKLANYSANRKHFLGKEKTCSKILYSLRGRGFVQCRRGPSVLLACTFSLLELFYFVWIIKSSLEQGLDPASLTSQVSTQTTGQ